MTRQEAAANPKYITMREAYTQLLHTLYQAEKQNKPPDPVLTARAAKYRKQLQAYEIRYELLGFAI